jgi:hypothetical protein
MDPLQGWDTPRLVAGIEPKSCLCSRLRFLANRSANLLHQKAVTLLVKGSHMAKGRARLVAVGLFALSFSTLRAQSPQQIIQQVVDVERKADQNDHSNWIYLEESDKPKEHVVQWVAATQRGDVERILEKDDQQLPEVRQRDRIEKFLHDTRAQNKQVEEANHDNRQIDDLLKLLPAAFVWTQTGSTATTTSLHFDPAPNFHPPTREARVFSSMTGDLVVDNQQHRICKIKGHLIHDVTFGGGILGRLKEKSSFALDQQRVGPSYWELSQIHVHLEGNALLFKSVSLQQDDKRSKFQPEPADVSLEQAAILVMNQPNLLTCSESVGPAAGSQGPVPCSEKTAKRTDFKP